MLSEAGGDAWGGKLFFAVFGGFIALFLRVVYEQHLVPWWIRKDLKFEPVPDVDQPRGICRDYNVRIVNASPFIARDCWAYITLDDDNPSDRLNCVYGNEVTIPILAAGSTLKLNEDRIAWAFMVEPPLAKIDICAGESQALVFLKIEMETDFSNTPKHFWIPSERHYRQPRICLKANRAYHATVKIVSASARAREWRIRIDVRNTPPVTKIEPVCDGV